MISAQQIKNFIPQNASLNAPRRINVALPEFEQTISAFNHGFPLASAVDGGLKYEVSSLMPMNNAASLNQKNAMFPCISQPSSNRVLRPDPIDDSNGFQPVYGNARGNPTINGLASIKKRDALFAYKCPPIMSTQTQLAPMMPIVPF
tara:strand:+ start:21 stop:461 length:441 start_codon:yes stop_codon:yes gene_type:complete